MKRSIKECLSSLRLAGLSLLLTLVFGLSGCGGGGIGGVSIARIIGTDDMNTGYDHVWVTVYSIDLVTSSGTVNAYTNASGLQVDLSSLHDSSGSRFLWFNNVNFPAGTYTGINVTVSNNVNVFPTAATTATAATFGSATNNFVMSLTYSAPKTVAAGHDDIVLDFNLANWTLTGATITAPGNAFLTEGSKTTLSDDTRWQKEDKTGTVTNLSGTPGSQTFSLGTSSTAPTVTTTSTTALFNSDGSANPSLAAGQTVTVFGTYSDSTNSITATGIEIQVNSANSPTRVRGEVSNISTGAFTFNVSADDCERFVPDNSTLPVTTSSTTTFYDASGATTDQATFFSEIQNGTVVRVAGTLSSGSFAATSVWLVSGGNSTSGTGEGEGNNHSHVKVSGTPSALNTTASTFTVSSQEWEGFWGHANLSVTVVYNSSTTWSQNGTSIDQATALGLIGSGTKVQVRGSIDPTTNQITATKISFNSD